MSQSAEQAMNTFFHQWDTAGIPSLSALNKATKASLVEMIVGYRDNPPSRGKRPKIGDAVRMVLTNPLLTHVPKDDLATAIRNAFNSRGLKCEVKNLDWYPCAHAYSALPRTKPE